MPFDDGDCAWNVSLAATVRLTGFAGSGTPADAFRGEAAMTGTLTAALTTRGGGCDPGGSGAITGFAGAVGGAAGRVVIAGTLTTPFFPLDFDFPAGVWDGVTVTGPATAQVPNAQIGPFAATLVLAPP